MTKGLIIVLAFVGAFMLASPLPVQAKDIFGGSKVCGPQGSGNSAVCTDKDKVSEDNDPLSGRGGLLIKITNIIAFIGGAAAVIMIIVGAIRFTTSGTDISTGSRTDTDVEAARHTVASALVGLVVIVLARTILIYVLKRL